MNDKFEHLMYQSGLTADGCWDQMDTYDKEAIMKFAALIVLECAGVTLDYKNDNHYAGWCDHAEEILKHFGVE